MSRFSYTIIMLIVFLFSCTIRTENRKNNNILEEYNRKITEGYNNSSCWVESPLTILLELVGSNTVVDTRKISVLRLNKGETMTKLKIVIEDTGLLDDSNQKSESVFIMELIDNRWVIIN